MTLWTPANLAVPPTCWWDAQDVSTITGGTANGSLITAWVSKGSFKPTLVPGSGTPVYITNGIGGSYPAMQTGTSYNFFKYNYTATDPLPTGSAAMSIAGVFQSGQANYTADIGYKDRGLGMVGGKFGAPGNGDQYSSGSLATTRANIGVVAMDSGTSPYSGLFLDGLLVAGDYRSTFSTTTTGQVTVGINYNGNTPGYTGEFMIFSYVLQYDDRQKLEGYLAWKWGLQSYLNSAHPYASAAPQVDVAYTGSTNWTPTNLNIPASAWFDPTLGLNQAANGAVTSWYSRVGSAYAASIPRGWSYPAANTVNSITVPYFSSNSALIITDSANTFPVAPTPVTVFAVANDYGAQDGASPVSWGQMSSGARRSLSVGGGNYTPSSYTTNYSGDITWQGWYTGDMASTTPWGNTMAIMCGQQGPGAATDNGELELWKNGILVRYGLRRVEAPTSNDGMYIGAQMNSPLYPWYGNIAEIIILNYYPASAERLAIEGYLAWKYGLQSSLPSNHLYYSAAPKTGGTTPTGGAICSLVISN